MISVERRSLFGLLHERRLFYADGARLTPQETRPTKNELVSLVACPRPIEAGSNCIRSRQQFTVCVDLRRSADAVFKNLNATTRTAVRQSQGMHESITLSINGDTARRDFLDLANSTRGSKGLPPEERLKRTLDSYGHTIDFWVLYHNGRAMCSHVLLKDADIGKARLLYSASRRFEGRDEFRLCGVVNRYLHWREMEHYQNAGIATYDLGGIDDNYQSPGNKTPHFKLSFGGVVHQEYHYLIAGMKTAAFLVALLWERVTGHRLP
jgi:GNAT acetyltransferase-like protein